MNLVAVLHLIIILEIAEHYDGPTLHLPYHPPQVIHCVLQRALCHHECLGLSVSLQIAQCLLQILCSQLL